MQIPFQLHRRIPLIRRPFWQLDVVRRERDLALADRDAARRERDLALADRDATGRERDLALAERDVMRVRPPPAGPTVVNLPDPELSRYAREILALLRPMEAVDRRLVRKGRNFDGGYVMVDYMLDAAVVYSLGISDDVSWDLDMAALGCKVFQYDHTVSALPVQHPNFQFSQIGIAAQTSADGVFRSLEELVMRNGHNGLPDIILKMDIEGAEWNVLLGLPDAMLRQFSQIVLELHGFTAIDHAERRERILDGLRRLAMGHQAVHVHANNYGWIGLIGGVMLPDTLEVTYVRRRDHAFRECVRCFPTALDMPCNPIAADYFLGALGCITPADETPREHAMPALLSNRSEHVEGGEDAAAS